MNFLIAGIIGLTMFVGGLLTKQDIKPYKYDGFNPNESVLLGTTSFPTSLDTLTNPSATDSVATVSHSAQHANANDAIEAIEAKLGTGASTASNNTIFAGTGSGSSAFVTHATATSLTTTNFLANGSSTLQAFTSASGTIATLLSSNSTTTNLYVSNLASTTEIRANTGNIGNLTAGNISVTTCTGCSTGVGSWYFATTTASRYLAKTLSLNAGDNVFFGVSIGSGTNQGTLRYRISAPWEMASTTIIDATSVADDPRTMAGIFQATTTSTVTFEAVVGDAGQTKNMWIQVLANGWNNSF